MTPAASSEKKIDRRVQKTKQALYDALMRLLRTQDADTVTVSRLCEVANVNRSSFYKYYSTPADILREREKSLYRQFQLYWLQNRPLSLQEVLLTQLRTVQQEQEFCLIMFGPHGLPGFLEHMSDSLQVQCVAHFRQQNPKLTAVQAEYLFLYCANGCRGIVERWILNSCAQPPEHIAQLMAQLILSGTQSFGLNL